jgi:hypothetical protein
MEPARTAPRTGAVSKDGCFRPVRSRPMMSTAQQQEHRYERSRDAGQSLGRSSGASAPEDIDADVPPEAAGVARLPRP